MPGSECEGVCCKILCKVLVLQVCAVARWEVHGLKRAQIDEHVCVWVCVGVFLRFPKSSKAPLEGDDADYPDL